MYITLFNSIIIIFIFDTILHHYLIYGKVLLKDLKF